MDGAPNQQHLEPGFSVVVPVFNSRATLRTLVERLERVMAPYGAYEILLVNDGSADESWEEICALAAGRPRLRGVNFMRNYGQHTALLCGVRLASFATTVTLDDDLQHPPEEIPKLLSALAAGYDVVYGTPMRHQRAAGRTLATRIAKLGLRSALGVERAEVVSAFRAFRTDLRRAFERFQGPFVSLDVLLDWGARRFAGVPVRHEPRAVGRSQYTLRKLVSHTVNMATGLSSAPLRLANLAGFACTLFGIAVLAYVVGRYLLEGGAVRGFPFLASIIAIFSGTQLFALGILGEYVARLHARSVDRPAYVVRDIVHGHDIASSHEEMGRRGGEHE